MRLPTYILQNYPFVSGLAGYDIAMGYYSTQIKAHFRTFILYIGLGLGILPHACFPVNDTVDNTYVLIHRHMSDRPWESLLAWGRHSHLGIKCGDLRMPR